ncbi:hypothetical protein BDY19DRAFT_989795 [Irpex rosettiformis]|uniref:Uncharacterized protein n=1 Tax=Irpex rosettiformis TaxID=378272 RepID=A0ACB8UFR9_9APHY|nr:hypothetical protein BDY19DRAFT_989795 [Irpex rosettiformis]
MESHASSSTSAHPPSDYDLGDADVHEDEEPMVDPATGQKILRPRNAWILYRKTRLDDVPLLPDGSKLPMAKASSVISHWWKTETKEVRRKFELMAAAEKAEHKRRYPDYKYKPRTPHQIALAKEKKKVEKKMQAAKDKSKKAKPVESAPPPLTSMAHTSYIEAALANQLVVARQIIVKHGPRGPSPSMSFSSTPADTPSPLSLSDFEQGSSSTTTTSHQTPSPNDMLGLSLAPPSFNFSDQKSSLRAPRHIPARIPPRQRAKRHVSGINTTSGSRVPSSSSLVMLSPATSTPTSLSPLAWPPTSQYPSPQSGDEPLSSELVPRNGNELYWGDEPSGSNPTEGGSVSIDLDFNPASSGDIFGDMEYFHSMGLSIPERNEGVFEVSAAPFLGGVPEQIDVNLMNYEVSDQERERFESILNDFDFSAFQPANDATVDQTIPEQLSLSNGSVWEQWNAEQQQQPSPPQETSNMDGYTTHAPSRPQEQSMSPQYHASKYEEQQPAPLLIDIHQSQETVVQQENVPQGMPTMPFSPEVLADPEFQAMFAGYLERKQKQNNQPSSSTAQYTPPERAEEIHHPHPHCTQASIQHHQQYQEQYTSQLTQQMQCDASGFGEEQQHHMHTQSIHDVHTIETPIHTPPTQANRWVPPPGAMHAGTRRVAGSWRPPPSIQQETWSAPQSPVECAPGSRLPSWAGVPN